MKKIIPLLMLLMGIRGTAQLKIKDVIAMEYWCGYHATNDTIYAFFNTFQGSHPIAFPLPGGRLAKKGTGLFNSMGIVSQDGNYYISNPYNQGPVSLTQVATDTTGAALNNCIDVQGFGGTYILIRSDSSLWLGGDDDVTHLFHTSGAIVMRPTRLSAVGLKFKKVVIGNVRVLGLTTTGQIYEWSCGSGSIASTQKTIPRPAIDIAVGHYSYAIALIPKATGAQDMGYPYVWGSSWGDWGATTAASYTQPTDITALWGLTEPCREICVSWQSTHIIDSSRRLKGLGYNPQGEVGNGQEFVNRYTYTTWPNYGWTFTDFQNPVSAPIPQIGTATNWLHLYSNVFFTFYKYGMQTDSTLYSWGRGKTFVLGTGIYWDNPQENSQNANANHPNAKDQLSPTLVTPLTASFKTYTWNYPARGAGATQNLTVSNTTLTYTSKPVRLVNGTDTVCCTITAHSWTRISGPNTPTFGTPLAASTTVNGLVNGTYVFQDATTDNNQGMDTSQVTVIVNLSGVPPTVSAGANQVITLPINATVLTGTATGNGGATISSVLWTNVSGPSVPTFGTANALSTSACCFVAGTYVFRLTATDSNNNTASATVQVQVNPVPPANCNCLSFPLPTQIKP